MSTQPTPKLDPKALRSAIFRLILFPFLILWPAGDWLWKEAWILIGILYLGFGWNLVYLLRYDPALLAERMKRDFRAEQKSWDKWLMGLSLPFYLAFVFAGSLDHRWGWSTLPEWAMYLGWGLMAVSMWGIHGVMVANRFLSRVVRIQEGHQVITQGPYAWVRHPMYVSVVLMFFGWALSLRSLYTLYIAVPSVLALVFRTYFEDKTLHQELPGYAEYAQKIRYRLFPGVW